MIWFQVIGDGIVMVECIFPYRHNNQQLHHHCLRLSDAAAKLTAPVGIVHVKLMDLSVENVEGTRCAIPLNQTLMLMMIIMNK